VNKKSSISKNTASEGKSKNSKGKIGMHTFPVGVKFILQRNVAIIDEVAKIEGIKD